MSDAKSWLDDDAIELFKNRSRGLILYDRTLCRFPRIVPWQAETLIEALRHQVEANPGLEIGIAEFGCGVGLALLQIANLMTFGGHRYRCYGLDKGDAAFHWQPYQQRYAHLASLPQRLAGPQQIPIERLDWFPQTPAAISAIKRHHAEEMAIPGVGVLEFADPEFIRCDFDKDPWPLPEQSLNLAYSRTAVMYFADKLGFLERVHASLREGGIAIIHFDHTMKADFLPGELRRVKFPRPILIEDVLAAQRAKGFEIHGIKRSNSADFVIMMRKSGDARLDFGWKRIRSAGETYTDVFETEPWGTISHYLPRD